MHGVVAELPSLTPQEDGDPPRSKERVLGVDLIDPVFIALSSGGGPMAL